MKNAFPEYYQPSKQDLKNLWNEALFVPDANVLLGIYRYSTTTREDLLSVLTELQDRLWVPHQAALEYQRNRLVLITSQVAEYDKVIGQLRDAEKRLLTKEKGHPLVPRARVDDVKGLFAKLTQELDKQKGEYQKLIKADSLREAIDSIFSGRIGPAYSPERLKEIYCEGKGRYERKQPPGYEDTKDKRDDREYGDLVLWYQMIDHAQQEHRPVIFITDDTKSDWWQQTGRWTIGPRPELVEEISAKANVRFHMYTTEQLVAHAKEHLERVVNKSTLDEIRDLTKHRDVVDKVYRLRRASYLLCGKEVEVTEDTTTLFSEGFDKRVTLHTWDISGKWLVMPALAATHTTNTVTHSEGCMLSQRPGPAPLACSFDSEEQAREWCQIQGLTIVSAGDRRIERRYEL